MPNSTRRTAVKKRAPARAETEKPGKAPGKAAEPKARVTAGSLESQVQAALAELKRKSTQRNRDNLARFGITATGALGVSVADIRLIAKRLGRSHELAEALWETNCYEARMLASFVDEPERVTPAQMDRWCRDFDNWAVCDTACFHLFDRTPHAWAKIGKWSAHRDEFVKRAAFALLASLAGHDKSTENEPFLRSLALIERAAPDARNFVKKAVSWALRRLGERNVALNTASVKLAHSLSGSADPTSRWIGKDALKELTSAKVLRRMKARPKGE